MLDRVALLLPIVPGVVPRARGDVLAVVGARQRLVVRQVDRDRWLIGTLWLARFANARLQSL